MPASNFTSVLFLLHAVGLRVARQRPACDGLILSGLEDLFGQVNPAVKNSVLL